MYLSGLRLNSIVANRLDVLGLSGESLRNNGRVSSDDSLCGSSSHNLSLSWLDQKSKDESQWDQSQSNHSAVPGTVSSPSVSEASSKRAKGGSINQRNSSSKEVKRLVSVRERSKSNGDHVSCVVGSIVSKIVSVVGSLSLIHSIFGVASSSNVISTSQDSLLSVKAISVDSVSVNHSNGKGDDSGNENSHSQKSRDDHQGSSSLHGSSVLVGSEVK